MREGCFYLLVRGIGSQVHVGCTGLEVPALVIEAREILFAFEKRVYSTSSVEEINYWFFCVEN